VSSDARSARRSFLDAWLFVRFYPGSVFRHALRVSRLVFLSAFVAGLAFGLSPWLSLVGAVAVGLAWSAWQWSQSVGADPPPLESLSVASPVTTERLVLRNATATDAAAVGVTIDRVVLDAQGWSPPMGRQWVQVTRRQGSVLIPGFLVACDREGGRVLGVVAVSAIDRQSGTAELGWWMGPDARGRGLGTEALAAGIAVLHDQGIARVLVGTREENSAVRAALAKVGARLTETRLHRLPDGSETPSAWYVHIADSGAG
jgi:RimJ/RimL family protein N-acetyltransferase